MLVLTRRVLESVRIGDDVTVTVLHVRGDQVRLRFTSPQDVGVYREEIINVLSQAAKQALSPSEATRCLGGVLESEISPQKRYRPENEPEKCSLKLNGIADRIGT
jgi:carbon storage regulator